MAKLQKSGFVIKLTSETVQKLSEEEQKAKTDSISTNTIDASETESTKSIITDEIKNSQLSKEVIKDSDKSNQKQTSNDASKSKNSVSDNKTNEVNKGNESWGDYAPYVTYEGEEAIYTDPSTQHKYTWNKTTNSWDPQSGGDVPGRVYSYENDLHVYTDPDGSKSFWDEDKKAWLPKVDDDFLAFYQMSYGFVDNTKQEEVVEKKKPEKKQDAAGVKRKNEPQWFEPSEDKNTKVYVSNLPLDMTEEEFVDHMQKCGLVERDPSTQKMKVKLYMDKEQNCFKGDALCTYIKVESVDLALKLLDGSDFKGNKIKVEKAHFQLKGEYNPALKPKKKKKKELEKIKKMQQKLFDWRPEKFIGERSKHERVVIVKNLFHPTDFDKEVQLILDYQQDLREECGKCGDVRKVVIYDRHPEGVAQITMKEPEQADAVIQLINGRWFGKRQITAEIWDGRTKYRIAETDADISKRIDKWDKFLEDPEDKEKKVHPKETKVEDVGMKEKCNTSSELDTKEQESIVK
ncbi:HIV Tat-specific factor 1 homolog [Zerene cesonia]|uniref:HIV Tat-specific factor 1 homolog n=1 Tax=Zerene cesonia TaxID=33412 RepID=UPI0018E5325E|nr:HIV Tat-specific factor 1 homolog [Zerene cesonia]